MNAESLRYEETFKDLCLIRSLAHQGIHEKELLYLRYSSRARKTLFFYDVFGRKCGYIVWAKVNEETIHKIKTMDHWPSRQYEWSEGSICLVLDVCTIPSFKFDLIRCLSDFSKKHTQINYFRNKRFVSLSRVDRAKYFRISKL